MWCRPCRFNGASTTWSKMGGGTEGPRGRARRFNGASTTWSRMVTFLPGRWDSFGLASTEPRPRGRGWYCPKSGGDLIRGFNGASTTWSRMAFTNLRQGEQAVTLQRSLDHVVEDGPMWGQREHALGVASTEPRPRGRGWRQLGSP